MATGWASHNNTLGHILIIQYGDIYRIRRTHITTLLMPLPPLPAVGPAIRHRPQYANTVSQSFVISHIHYATPRHTLLRGELRRRDLDAEAARYATSWLPPRHTPHASQQRIIMAWLLMKARIAATQLRRFTPLRCYATQLRGYELLAHWLVNIRRYVTAIMRRLRHTATATPLAEMSLVMRGCR